MRLLTTALLLMTATVSQAQTPFTIIVMDPLSSDLSCACVKGYSQRNYPKLAAHIQTETGRPVNLVHAGTLADALKKTEGKADLIIGKESVVRKDGQALKLEISPLLALTGLDGKTTMTGLFVVPSADPVFTLTDLKQHKILFGKPQADEKHSAAFDLMKTLGADVPKSPETCGTCSDAAVQVVEGFKAGQKMAAVISSYAHPLLEGCGTVKKGELKIIGTTEEVPFVVVFASNKLQQGERDSLEKALRSVGKNADLAKALETKLGFVSIEAKKK